MTAYPLSVVVVSPDASEPLRRWLELRGYRARAACDGAGAMQLLAEDSADVLVLDLDMDWVGAFDLLRRLDDLPGQPLKVALSSSARREDCRLAYDVGFDHFLPGPSSPEPLLRLLEEHADRVWAACR